MNEQAKAELIQKWISIANENPWISQLGSRDPVDLCAFEDPLNPKFFKECETIDELITYLTQGNWMLGQAFYYKNLCFINQINGGDEWLTIRDDIDFNSISAIPMAKEGITYFKNHIEDILHATPKQLRTLTYSH